MIAPSDVALECAILFVKKMQVGTQKSKTCFLLFQKFFAILTTKGVDIKVTQC